MIKNASTKRLKQPWRKHSVRELTIFEAFIGLFSFPGKSRRWGEFPLPAACSKDVRVLPVRRADSTLHHSAGSGAKEANRTADGRDARGSSRSCTDYQFRPDHGGIMESASLRSLAPHGHRRTRSAAPWRAESTRSVGSDRFAATGDRRYTIMPAATVSLVPGSMRMKEPVARLRR